MSIRAMQEATFLILTAANRYYRPAVAPVQQ
jgi:hypothetical protein